MVSSLTAALQNLAGDAVAIGTVVGDDVEIGCRGSLGGTSVDERTVFYGASLTKQLVGVAAAQACLAGLLTVTDSITHWIPELPRWMERVRLGHLIHHTSGLPDLSDPALGALRGNAELVGRFAQVSAPDLTPGVRFAYANAGYVLLAEAVSRCVGRPADQVLSRLVQPLTLSDTRFGGTPVPLRGQIDPPGTIGDGGLWTSVRDLTTWLRACNDAVFGTDTMRLVETGTSSVDGSPIDYAWGVRVTETVSGRVISHGGSWEPWLAKTVRIPGRRVAVAVLSVGAVEREVSRTGTELAEALAASRGDVRGDRGGLAHPIQHRTSTPHV